MALVALHLCKLMGAFHLIKISRNSSRRLNGTECFWKLVSKILVNPLRLEILFELSTLISFESWLFILDMSPSKSVLRDHHGSSDKRDGNHTESRNSSNDQRIGENDRGHQVVKTCSVHTTALPTVVYRWVTKTVHYLVIGKANVPM